jgi:hypothetical protein
MHSKTFFCVSKLERRLVVMRFSLLFFGYRIRIRIVVWHSGGDEQDAAWMQFVDSGSLLDGHAHAQVTYRLF